MKRIIHKFFIDHEKEEVWLNEMSADGLALIGMFFGFYRFEYCLPNEYIYRIELLENLPERPEGRKYITFMLENNVEPVTSWWRWVYFRCKAEYGEFDLYSDIDSRLAHYQRIYSIINSVMILECIVGIAWIAIAIMASTLGHYSVFWGRSFLFGCFLLGLGFAFLNVCRPLRKKIKVLRQEKLLRE
jgi:hypothetical protein